jgi:hypothetical protein
MQLELDFGPEFAKPETKEKHYCPKCADRFIELQSQLDDAKAELDGLKYILRSMG